MIGLSSKEGGRRDNLEDILRELHMIGLLSKEGGRRDNLEEVLRELHHDWTFKQRR